MKDYIYDYEVAKPALGGVLEGTEGGRSSQVRV